MGLLVDGVWQDKWYDTDAAKGRFVRADSSFRNWVTADGAPGPSGEGGFKAEPGRYHLYVSYACPWAHRTLIFRALKAGGKDNGKPGLRKDYGDSYYAAFAVDPDGYRLEAYCGKAK